MFNKRMEANNPWFNTMWTKRDVAFFNTGLENGIGVGVILSLTAIAGIFLGYRLAEDIRELYHKAKKIEG